MRKLTEEQRQARAEYRARWRALMKQLAVWDLILSGLAGAALVIWLAVYVREGSLQGADVSVVFWAGLAAGLAILTFLARKFYRSIKMVRKI